MHEGHRKRMIDKLLTNAEVLSDHELLEILLFYAVPRKNVNTTAHNLLDTLGTLENVMQSDEATLTSIDGIGERTAAFFITVNEIYNRIKTNPQQLPKLFSFDASRSYLINTFRGLNEEKFIALFMNKQGELIMRKIFSSHSELMVNIDLSELQKGIAAKRPYSITIAHNHLTGNPLPSVSDDEATEKLTAILMLNKVTLNDHIIVAGDRTYSYRSAGKIEKYYRNIDKYFDTKY